MHNISVLKSVVLASKSNIRKACLEAVGLDFKTHPSTVNEEAIKLHATLSADELAKRLAFEKALEVSDSHPGEVVIGCDQVATCHNKKIAKSRTLAECRNQLHFLKAQTHQLFSAICLVKDSELIWEKVERVDLTMRRLSDNEIDAYIQLDKPLQSCGSYYFESYGRHLFSSVKGCNDAILGMPLVPLLNELHKLGIIQLH